MMYAGTMTKAIWQGATIAESDDVLLVEFAVYFPRASVTPGALRESSVASTYCHWKGVACTSTSWWGTTSTKVQRGHTRRPTRKRKRCAEALRFGRGVEVTEPPAGDPMMDPGGPVGSRTGYEALCWLMVRSEETSLDAARIEQAIGLDEAAVAGAFAHPHAGPFIQRYKWSLVDGVLQKG